MSSSSGSGSGSDSGSDSSGATEVIEKPIEADTNRIPPITERKLALRNQLAIYQVDEEMFEDEKFTVTGRTATDVVLPNIREADRFGKQIR